MTAQKKSGFFIFGIKLSGDMVILIEKTIEKSMVFLLGRQPYPSFIFWGGMSGI